MGVDIDDTKRRMQGAVSALETEFQGLRTGRASATMLEPISVNAYGAQMPINQVATIAVPESRLLSVQVWDQSMVEVVEKAIRESGLGLNPQSEGNLVRIPVPDLSAERRDELVKVAKKYAETARVSIRNVRRDAIEQARKGEKDGEYGEDERHGLETQLQKLTDEYVAKIDELLASKEKDITTL